MMAKKFITVIALMFIATSAYADDQTYMFPIKANSTDQMRVDMPVGKSLVDVWADNKESISCTFLDKNTQEVVFEKKNVQRCLGYAELLTHHHTVLTRITNNSDHTIQVKVWVRDPQTKF